MTLKLLVDPRHRVILSSKLVRYSRPSIRSWLRQSDRRINLAPEKILKALLRSDRKPDAMPPLEFRFESIGEDRYGAEETFRFR